MIGKRQFSLGYLLLEVVWICLALGLIRWQFLTRTFVDEVNQTMLEIFASAAAMFVFPAAVLGLVGRMRAGVIFGLVSFVVVMLLSAYLEFRAD
jgi:hypothetical protein